MLELKEETDKKMARQAAALLSALVVGTIASRYLRARRISTSELMAEALLDTHSLEEAATSLPTSPATALAHCAAYLVGAAYRSLPGVRTVMEDPVGTSRTHNHPYTEATATVFTEADWPEQMLTFAILVPRVGEVRGTRRYEKKQFPNMTRSTPYTVQINLADGYSAQLASEFQDMDALITGRTRLSGTLTLRDNRGNVGLVHIGESGTLCGTITCGPSVVGRFAGKITTGLDFRPYSVKAGSSANA